MLEMVIGDVVDMTSCEVVHEQGENKIRARFKSPRGKKFSFLFLGADVVTQEDAIAALEALGWRMQETST